MPNPFQHMAVQAQGIADTAKGSSADALRKKQADEAKAYRAGMPALQERQGSMAADQGRQELAQQMAGINQQANQRGMLYSGLRQGAQSGAQAQMAGNVAAQRAQINAATETQADQMENAVIGQGLQQRQAGIQQADDSYNLALKRKQQETNVAKGIGTVLGAGAGALSGRR